MTYEKQLGEYADLYDHIIRYLELYCTYPCGAFGMEAASQAESLG